MPKPHYLLGQRDQPELASDPVVTRAELCAMAKVSQDTIRRAVKSKKLTMLKLSPRRVGFRRSEVERWLNSCAA